MSFSFRKPSKAKSLRKKIEVDDDDVEPQVDTVVKRPNKSIAKEAKSDSKRQSKSGGTGGAALSFGGDDEQGSESLVPIKTTSNPRMVKANINHDLFSNRTSTPTQTSDYSAESLQALKAGQLHKPPAPNADQLSVNDAFSAEFKDIPDATAIHAARKLREERRAAGIIGEKDTGFISLADEKSEKMKEHESRLVTEDQELEGEEAFDDHVGDQINFGGDAVKKEEQRRKAEFEQNLLVAQEEDVDDEAEEELRQWEDEQIRKGRAKKSDADRNSEKAEKPRPKVYSIPTAVSLPNLSEASRRINNLVATKENNHDANLAMLAHTKADFDRSITASAALEVDRKMSSERYTYFQELLQYIRELADFLNAKFAELEKLEEEYQETLDTGLEVVQSRRFALMDYDFSQMVGMEGLVSDSPENQRARQQARRNRRAARLQARTGPMDEYEGLSTDDELDAESEAKYQERKVETRLKRSRLLEDATEDFKSVILVKQRFETWKVKYPKDYDNGFGGWSMPGVFAIFVRQELVDWEPLQSTSTSFDTMHWHKQLSDYGIRDASDVDEDDPDTRLLMKIMEKTCIPRLKARIASYDVWSGRQTKALVRILGGLMDYSDGGSGPFKNLVSAIETRIGDVVAGLSQRYAFHVAAPSIPVSEMGRAAADRWFWTVFKLLQNIVNFKRWVRREALQQWAIDSILNGCLVKGLRVTRDYEGDLVKYEKIMKAIPTEWIGDVYSVPDFLRSLENECREFARRNGDVAGRNREFAERLARVFVEMKNFQEASLLGKMHR